MTIKYVCLSDLHLGDVDSLLCAVMPNKDELDLTKNSPVVERLVGLIQAILQHDGDPGGARTLILNGDTLDLAFGRIHEVLTVFLRVLQLANPRGGAKLFGRIIYIPGNHDHHIWEVARADQYANHLAGDSLLPPDGLPAPNMWHTTNVVDAKIDPIVTCRLLDGGFERLLGYRPVEKIEIAYPNFALVKELGDNRRRAVLFNHGHSFETVYTAMTFLKSAIFPGRKQPTTVAEIESENFAWIDFVWSMLGRQGDVGEAVEAFYKMVTDSIGRPRLIQRLSSIPESGLLRVTLEGALGWLGGKIGSVERNICKHSLSDGTRQQLRDYLNGPVLAQLNGNHVQSVEDLTFVFGHTHKPFAEKMDGFRNYGGHASTYNTGGWVVDADGTRSLYGASVVFVDENLECSSLDLFKEFPALVDAHTVTAEQAKGQNERDNALTRQLAAALNTPPVSNAAGSFLEALKKDMEYKLDRAQKREATMRH